MPSRLNYDREQFEKYIRFKPELEMNYVYYYDRVNNPSIYAQFPGLDEEGIARRMCDIMDHVRTHACDDARTLRYFEEVGLLR